MDRSPDPSPVYRGAHLVVATRDSDEDYCSIGYVRTGYGWVPTENWDKYVATTGGDDR
jgi:hypothetical protein